MRPSRLVGQRFSFLYDQRKNIGSMLNTRIGSYSHSMMRFSVVPAHFGKCRKISASLFLTAGVIAVLMGQNRDIIRLAAARQAAELNARALAKLLLLPPTRKAAS